MKRSNLNRPRSAISFRHSRSNDNIELTQNQASELKEEEKVENIEKIEKNNEVKQSSVGESQMKLVRTMQGFE